MGTGLGAMRLGAPELGRAGRASRNRTVGQQKFESPVQRAPLEWQVSKNRRRPYILAVASDYRNEDPQPPGRGVAGAQGELAEVVRRAKALDREAFGALYSLTVRPVYRYLAARLRTDAEAEDVTQEVFMAALSGIQGLRAEDEAGVLAWLLQIARHKLADQLRRRYRQPEDPLDETMEVVATDPQPPDAAEAEEERRAVREALEHLTPEQREVIMCKYILGLDNERTAAVVGKNVNATNQLQHRALRSLQRLLGQAEAPP